MVSISNKLQKVFVETKNGQKEFFVFKNTSYPFKILSGESYPIFNFLTKPKYIFDIGANIGAASFFFAERYPESKIYSFEPAKDLIPILERNLNNYKNISIINKAVKNVTDKKSKLFIDSHDFDGSTLHDEHINSNNLNINHFEIVETINIADFCLENKINEIDIIKIDAEGSEYDILYSLKNIISKASVIYCESHNFKNYLKINDLLKKSHNIFRDNKKKNDLFETIYIRKNYFNR